MLKIAHSNIYQHPLPEKHRFPMEKYQLLPQQLLYEGLVHKENFFAPSPISEKEILVTHDKNYWKRLKNLALTKLEIRKTGFPLSATLVKREITIAGGTIECARYAKEYGVAMNIAGGTHHAFTNRGEGFCLLNDQAIASHFLLQNNLAKRILIVDLDVHQGNGTAQIFESNNQVFTFSMHGKHNYPLKKEKSDLDIELLDGTQDYDYLNLLEKNLHEVWEKHSPDFVFYQSGVDIIAQDKLGRLGVSIDGCKIRDEMVLKKCWSHKVPVVCCMGGGYAPKIYDIIEAHANTFRTAANIFF
jgi:acetoin utilization deacetylase AcuC-like enzyme